MTNKESGRVVLRKIRDVNLESYQSLQKEANVRTVYCNYYGLASTVMKLCKRVRVLSDLLCT